MLTFEPKATVGDLIQAVALLVAAGGLILTAIETRRSARQRRVQQIVELQHQFYSDADLMDAYYLIEYGEFEYDGNFHGSKLEKSMDRLLVHFESIASLYEAKVVSARELDIVAYNYLVIYQNRGIQQYFDWLDSWYKTRGIKEQPFGTFRAVGAVVERRRFHLQRE